MPSPLQRIPPKTVLMLKTINLAELTQAEKYTLLAEITVLKWLQGTIRDSTRPDKT